MAKKYSIKITLKKGLQNFLFYFVPYLLSSFVIDNPEVASITLGSLAVMLNNYLKNRRR